MRCAVSCSSFERQTKAYWNPNEKNGSKIFQENKNNSNHWIKSIETLSSLVITFDRHDYIQKLLSCCIAYREGGRAKEGGGEPISPCWESTAKIYMVICIDTVESKNWNVPKTLLLLSLYSNESCIAWTYKIHTHTIRSAAGNWLLYYTWHAVFWVSAIMFAICERALSTFHSELMVSMDLFSRSSNLCFVLA